MGNQQVTVSDFDLGWFIGIMDGEGCFCLYKAKRSYSASIKLVNTNPYIIEKCAEILDALEIKYLTYDSWRAANQKPAKRLEIIGLGPLKRFFDILYPYFYCRLEQATVLRDFVELRQGKTTKDSCGDEEYSCYLLLKELNQRGPGTSETAR